MFAVSRGARLTQKGCSRSQLRPDGALYVAVDAVGAEPVEEAVGREDRKDLPLHARAPQRHALAVQELVDLVELRGAPRVDVVGALQIEDDRVEQNRPLSSRSTAMPANVSSAGFVSRSRNTCVAGSRPSNGTGGVVAT